MIVWVFWFAGLAVALVAPWTSPKLPISGCLAIDAAVLLLGGALTAAVIAGSEL